MPNQSDVIYRYDGTFDGLLCCVFESYYAAEVPADVTANDAFQATLFPSKVIVTDSHRAQRVLTSIPKRMGNAALDLAQKAFLTCLEQKALAILLFLRLGYTHGCAVTNMLTHAAVAPLVKAVRHLEREAHLLKGFVRFSALNGVLAAEIEPKNCALPLLAQHFCERYPEERFVIHDKTRGMALLYQPYTPRIVRAEGFRLPDADSGELAYRRLWKVFYDAIEVEGRHNPKCRMSHMPKRYWKYMTELRDEQKSVSDGVLPPPETPVLSIP
ncbi:MAG: TIGR03915 family putative DNA repair protein [Clostridiales bacterium]|jgi:probable DNA metabolism protein|nr:TIGR03915 family putative DNA repair protein [Clostridiales bacterium]